MNTSEFVLEVCSNILNEEALIIYPLIYKNELRQEIGLVAFQTLPIPLNVFYSNFFVASFLE